MEKQYTNADTLENRSEQFPEAETVTVKVSKDTPPQVSRGVFLEKFINAFLLCLAAIVPVFVLTFSGISLEFSKSVVLSGGVLLAVFFCLVFWLRSGTLAIPKNPSVAFLGIISFWYALSSVFSGSVRQSFFGAGESGTGMIVLVLFLFAFLISIFVNTQKRALGFLFAFFSAAWLVFLFQALHFIFPAQTSLFGVLPSKLHNIIGSWGDFGIFSGLMIVLSLLALEIFAEAKKVFKKFLYGILLLAFFFHLCAAPAFSWLAISVISWTAAFFTFKGKRKGAHIVPSFSISFVVALSSLVIAVSQISPINTRFNVSDKMFEALRLPVNTEVRPSWSGTFDIATANVKSGVKPSVIGTGPNRFFFAWGKFHPAGVNLTQWWNVDFNEGVGFIPASIVTVGIVGLLLWILFLASFIFVGAKSLLFYRAGKDQLLRFLNISFFTGAAYLWFSVCMNPAGNVILGAAFMFTGLFAAALSLSGTYPVRMYKYISDPRKGFFFTTAILLFVGAVILLGYFVFDRMRSVFFYRQAILESVSGNLDASEASLNRALSLSEDDVYYRFYSSLASYRARQVLERKDISADEIRLQWSSMFKLSMDNALKAAEIDPSNYANRMVVADAYASLVPLKIPDVSSSAFERASENYVLAQKLSPQNPAIPLALAQLNVSAGKKDEAEKYLKQALEMKSNYTESLAFLSDIEAASGNMDKAISYLEQAANQNPNDANILLQLGFMKFKNADYKEAVGVLERAVALVPDYANAKYFLGLSYSKLGRVEDAIKQFEEIQAFNPENSDLDSILRNLRSGYPPFSVPPSPASETEQEPSF